VFALLRPGAVKGVLSTLAHGLTMRNPATIAAAAEAAAVAIRHFAVGRPCAVFSSPVRMPSSIRARARDSASSGMLRLAGISSKMFIIYSP
jgi:hypothetical protein